MNLDDTKSRLRDYLSDKARVVPDDATPPVLTHPTRPATHAAAARRRTWPALVAAAAVLAATVPLLTRLGDGPEPAAPSGAPIAVPHVVLSEKTLYDGGTKVPMPPGAELVGRATGGWLVLQRDPLVINRGAKTRAGVLTKSGRVLQRGPDDIFTAILSPDGTKAAVGGIAPKQKHNQTILRVIDLASGNELSSLRTPFAVVLQGWNNHGIWFSEKSGRAGGPFVWKPGQSARRRLAIPGFRQNLASVPGSDRLVVTTSVDNHRSSCARVVELQASGTFRTALERCTHDVKSNNPVLSPDGRYLLIAGRGIAVEVDTGRDIPLKNLPDPGWRDHVGFAFEDATHVLLLTHEPDRSTPPIAPKTVKQDGRTATLLAQTAIAVVYRCDVPSGTCSAIYRTPAPGLTLPHL